MRYFQGTTQFSLAEPTAVTLGKFDGLHRGHQKLITEILMQRAHGLSATVFIIAPPQVPRILNSREKLEKLEALGVDCVIECPFIPEILRMAPEQFVSEILVSKLNAKYLAVGTDFRFGFGRSGDAGYLQSLRDRFGFSTAVLEKERQDGREISSTYVREALAAGQMELVSSLLGYPYFLSGTVQRGRQLGRKIGMPTLNLVPGPYKLLPANGVYYSRTLYEGREYRGITNVGSKPTVDGSFLGAETYLYDFADNLYGKDITVELLAFRRPEQKFASIDALKTQMQKDILSGKEFFREH